MVVLVLLNYNIRPWEMACRQLQKWEGTLERFGRASGATLASRKELMVRRTKLRIESARG